MQQIRLFHPYIKIICKLEEKKIFLLFVKSIYYCYGFSTQLAIADIWYLLVLQMILPLEVMY